MQPLIRAIPVPDTTADPFAIGWRYVTKELPGGEITCEMVPLTLEDALHPQEDDHISNDQEHAEEYIQLYALFRARVRGKGIILGDCRVDWNVGGLVHSPDLTYIAGGTRPRGRLATWYVGRQPGQVRFAVEIVSLSTRRNDLVPKVQEYHQAGLPLYLVADRFADEGPTLTAYQWAPEGYITLPADPRGGFTIEEVGIRLVFEGDRLQAYDAATDELLRAPWEAIEELEREHEARLEAEEQARLSEEQARLAEEQARLAEQQARQAEEQARREAAARSVLEDQLRQLQARLAQLEASPADPEEGTNSPNR